MRWVVVVILGLSLLLAGCSGQPTDATPTPEQPTTSQQSTETPEPATATPTATPDPVSEAGLPPGTSEAGITNRSALLAAHQAAITGSDYRVSARSYMPNRYQQTHDRIRIQVDTDTQRVYWTADLQPEELDGKNATVTMYSADGMQYQRTDNYYRQFYTAYIYENSFRFLHRSTGGLNRSLNRTLTAGNLTYAETISDRNTTYTRFDIQYDDWAQSNGTVLIRNDGLIVELTTDTHDIDRGLTSYRLHTDEDITVEQVSWTDKALQDETEQLREPPTPDPSSTSGSSCSPDADVCETIFYTAIDWLF